MANVFISPNLSDAHCIQKAQAHQRRWQSVLTLKGSTGDFTIGHGEDGSCSDVHKEPKEPFNARFYIWSDPHRCPVFLSEGGNTIAYAGAGRDAAGAYLDTGHCKCGSGH